MNKCKTIVNNLLGLLLGGLTLLMFSQVVSRYIFNLSITWSEEFPRLLIVWIVFLGLFTVNYEDHLIIDLIKINKLQKKINLIFVLFISSIVSYYGFVLCFKIQFQVFPVTNIPRYIQYISYPISFITFIMVVLIKLKRV